MNNLSNVMVVGLTGQTGAGKSTVSETFKKAGFAVIDADRTARYVQRTGSPCLEELVDYFGKEILNADGSLARHKLASIVFGHSSKLEALNSICYPYICNEILEQIKKLASMGKQIILLDAPMLFESRTDDFCSIIISVISKEPLRLQRIMKRDGISEELALKRISSQNSQKFFVENSDFIIKNNDDMEHLIKVAEEVASKIWSYYLRDYSVK